MKSKELKLQKIKRDLNKEIQKGIKFLLKNPSQEQVKTQKALWAEAKIFKEVFLGKINFK